MALTSPRWVTSGFYRNHLYVALGLTTLAGLAGLSAALTWWPALVAAVASYLGAICWLYEKKKHLFDINNEFCLCRLTESTVQV